MAKAPTGELIEVMVGELADPDVRAVPAALEGIVGTSTGFQIGEQEIDTREFGTGAASLWDDGAVVSRNWSIPLSMNYRPEEAGNAIVEDAGLTSEEIYVEFYPLGNESGAPMYSGYATVNGYSVTAPRDGIMTATCTLRGRGALTKGTVTP